MVVVAVTNGRGGCGLCCGFFGIEIYYFIVVVYNILL